MTRDELATLLENEGYLNAANRVMLDEDPRRVLSELRPFTPLYNDNPSHDAVVVFQDVMAGREEIQ